MASVSSRVRCSATWRACSACASLRACGIELFGEGGQIARGLALPGEGSLHSWVRTVCAWPACSCRRQVKGRLVEAAVALEGEPPSDQRRDDQQGRNEFRRAWPRRQPVHGDPPWAFVGPAVTTFTGRPRADRDSTERALGLERSAATAVPGPMRLLVDGFGYPASPRLPARTGRCWPADGVPAVNIAELAVERGDRGSRHGRRSLRDRAHAGDDGPVAALPGGAGVTRRR